MCLNEADEAIAGCRTQRSVALKGKSAVFTPLVIPLSKSFYPVMTGLRGTCGFNGGEKKNKTACFPFLHLSSRHFLSLPSLFVLPPSPFLRVGSALSQFFLRPPTSRSPRESPPQQFSQHGLSLFTPRHYQQWTSCKQHLLLLARHEKKKKACHLDHTDHETAAAAAAASIRRTSFKSRPSHGRRH